MANHYQRAKIRRAAGCVVYRHEAGALLLLLIHDRYGTWSLPKGHLEPGEDEKTAAAREVWEETGVRGVLGPLVGRIAYQVFSKQGRPRVKQVAFFLMRAEAAGTIPLGAEGIDKAEWCAPAEALARLTYPQVRAIVEAALPLIG